jgi:hypothetical protein
MHCGEGCYFWLIVSTMCCIFIDANAYFQLCIPYDSGFKTGLVYWYLTGMLSHQLQQHVIDGKKSIIQNPTEALR